LLVGLITSETIELFGNSRLADEYRRYADELKSESASFLLAKLAEKMNLVEVDEMTLTRCKHYFKPEQSADVMHAATSLQTSATLITNDKDFDRIGRSGLIRVWSISEAIGKLSRA